LANDENLVGVTFAMGVERVIAKRLDLPSRLGRRDDSWMHSSTSAGKEPVIQGSDISDGAAGCPDLLLGSKQQLAPDPGITQG
jgi:hypothetical protein